ncbi:MAG: hypothetical protein IJ840_04680 [Bacteroidales bacterium]|nr:hypothetical protein [Bacteroidales bacterium]
MSALLLAACDKDNDNGFAPGEEPWLQHEIPSPEEEPETTVPLPPTRLALSEAELEMISPSNDFTFDFFREYHKGDTDMLLSPLGFQLTWAMVGNIVEDEKALCELLGFEGESINGVNTYFKHLIEALSGEKCSKEFKLANALMADVLAPKYPRSFLDVLKSDYFLDYQEIEAKPLSEQPRGSRPEDVWCKDKTDGMISEAPFAILETQASLFSALCFNGKWQDKFDKELTRPSDFHVGEGEASSLPFMHKKSKVGYYQDDNLSAISLPFGDGTYNLTILLPKTRFNVGGVLEKMDSEAWDTMREGFVYKNVAMAIPIFSTTYSQKVFFDFKFKDDINPFIAIGQNAVFKMDEDGASAAATTQAITPTAAGPSGEEVVEFVADSPFLYTISEAGSGLVLFIGQFSGKEGDEEETAS